MSMVPPAKTRIYHQEHCFMLFFAVGAKHFIVHARQAPCSVRLTHSSVLRTEYEAGLMSMKSYLPLGGSRELAIAYRPSQNFMGVPMN